MAGWIPGVAAQFSASPYFVLHAVLLYIRKANKGLSRCSGIVAANPGKTGLEPGLTASAPRRSMLLRSGLFSSRPFQRVRSEAVSSPLLVLSKRRPGIAYGCALDLLARSLGRFRESGVLEPAVTSTQLRSGTCLRDVSAQRNLVASLEVTR